MSIVFDAMAIEGAARKLRELEKAETLDLEEIKAAFGEVAGALERIGEMVRQLDRSIDL
ncbi:hypothetical protein [Aureimonas psammosilenae]|uniref:hypothetical protein n=1 Tax=Aureimonas psammosilenae TaxID=2495496 RepID=UPI00186A1B69|nr:hypothetical protein [Aureimonas psammosilenae]